MQEDFVTQREFWPNREQGGLKFIQSLVATLYGVTTSDLFASKRGGRRVVFARHIAMYLMHMVFGCSLTEVARFFGRERGSASYALHKVEDLREDPCFDRQLTQLENLIRSAADIEVLQ